MGLFGGLALFLFGMEQMAAALKSVAGERMKTILATLTKNRFMGVLTGAFVTAVIQSSSVTTVLVVGFITAGLMSMAQSIGVIMGANIGTTITAQIIAFKVTQFSLAMVAVGYAMVFCAKSRRIKDHGHGILGLGLVFLGMSIMGEAMQPLRSYEPFLSWMTQMEDPALGILAGALFTALVQSSSATTGVVIVMAGQGLISLPAGIALAFGANIGTCVTALLASIGKPREALRSSVVHVLFNTAGVLIWLPFIDELAGSVRTISPVADTLAPAERVAAETPRQIANAHTIFNIANTLIFIWFVPVFARVVQWLVPDRPLAEERKGKAKYLDTELLATPSLALDRSRLELLHMGDLVQEMLKAILSPVLHGGREPLEEIRRKDDVVDVLHGHIVTYLGKISQTVLSEAQTEELIKLLAAANNLENVGDIIETNLVALGLNRIEAGVTISPATQTVLADFHAAVVRSLDNAILAITQKNEEAAGLVVGMKEEIDRLADSAAVHEARRLVAEEPQRLEAYTLETDLLANLKRVYDFSRRMARVALPR
ncbi:MAG: Na/Pi cotransporter family protein [bacterium]|nr:Na/Pi cotransporter family protein [bacterium]